MNEPVRVATERTLAAHIKVYFDLHTPDETNALRPLLIALHGYGDNKAWMMRQARLLAPPDFVIAALQGFHQHLKEPGHPGEPLRYGFGWLTNFHPEDSIWLHHRAVLDLIETLARERLIDRAQVFLLGFSQSVALNYRFVFTYPNIARGVVGICGGLPGDWETSEIYVRTEACVFHLCGVRDEFYTPARTDDYAARLRLRAADVDVRRYESAHEIAPAMRADIRAWLDAKAAKSAV